jgi:hypothetical protein
MALCSNLISAFFPSHPVNFGNSCQLPIQFVQNQILVIIVTHRGRLVENLA